MTQIEQDTFEMQVRAANIGNLFSVQTNHYLPSKIAMHFCHELETINATECLLLGVAKPFMILGVCRYCTCPSIPS